MARLRGERRDPPRLPRDERGGYLVLSENGAPLADLVAAGDALLPAARRDGVATVRDLQQAARRHRGKRGMRTTRAALGLLREGVASRPESLLRLLLVSAGLPEPAIATPVGVGRGLVLHPDLAYPMQRIAIEYEGDGHRTDRFQWERDIRRRELFEDAGWRVIRVAWGDLIERRTLIERVRRALISRTSP